MTRSFWAVAALAIMVCLQAGAQSSGAGENGAENPGKPATSPQTSTAPLNNPPPRSDEDSSSNDTKISLAPPAGEAGHAPGADTGNIQEMHPWDPHKADKAVEVGDFYLRRKNYPAAISRYREALYWKDDDADALFRLGQALEATGQYSEACEQYEHYLKVLPEGKFARDVHKSLERLKDKPDNPVKAEGPIL